MARSCVLIDSNHQVMTRAVGELVGRLVTDELRRNRVNLRLGRRVRDIDRRRRGWRLVLDDGSEVDADVVVATTGERPDTGWLDATPGLDTTDGVLCDETLRVAGAEAVVAAGAVALWPNLRYDNRPRRCGHEPVMLATPEERRGHVLRAPRASDWPPCAPDGGHRSSVRGASSRRRPWPRNPR